MKSGPWLRWRWVAVGAVILIALLVYLAHVGWPARPASLPDCLKAVGCDDDLVIFVYDFWGNFIDHEHLWRIEAKPELRDSLAQRLDLRQLPLDQVPASFWRQPPYWWRLRKDAAAKFFISQGFVADRRGPDGEHFLLMLDEEAAVIYGWYKSNF